MQNHGMNKKRWAKKDGMKWEQKLVFEEGKNFAVFCCVSV